MLLPIVWKMLNHMHLTFATSVMAGVIAWWQMEWPIILWVKTFSHTPYGVSKFAGKTFSSDLRKLTAVSKSLSLSKN